MAVFDEQAHFEEHLQDTEVDAPMANLHLHNLQVRASSFLGGLCCLIWNVHCADAQQYSTHGSWGAWPGDTKQPWCMRRHIGVVCCLLQQSLAQKETLVGSWPAAGKQSAADAALPFFSGRPIRTTNSNLSSMGGVQRTSSFTGAHPGSARSTMGMENSYAAEQLCYNACNSAPITPRSPSFIGYSEEVSRTPAEEAQCVERICITLMRHTWVRAKCTSHTILRSL
jgi:hypothetical protein